MPSIKWMQDGVGNDCSISKSPTESIAGHHRGPFMHGASGFKAGWDKWCGMDVRIGNFFFLHYHAYAFSKISGTYFPPVFCPGYFLTCRFQAIAVHTFSILVLRWNPPVYASKAMVIGVWALTAAIVGISYAVHRHQHYYGASGGCKSQSSFLRNR